MESNTSFEVTPLTKACHNHSPTNKHTIDDQTNFNITCNRLGDCPSVQSMTRSKSTRSWMRLLFATLDSQWADRCSQISPPKRSNLLKIWILQVWVIPTGYARKGDWLYLHGKSSSHMMKALATGSPVCITVTLVNPSFMRTALDLFCHLALCSDAFGGGCRWMALFWLVHCSIRRSTIVLLWSLASPNWLRMFSPRSLPTKLAWLTLSCWSMNRDEQEIVEAMTLFTEHIIPGTKTHQIFHIPGFWIETLNLAVLFFSLHEQQRQMGGCTPANSKRNQSHQGQLTFVVSSFFDFWNFNFLLPVSHQHYYYYYYIIYVFFILYSW